MTFSNRKSSIGLALLILAVAGAFALAAPGGTQTKGQYDALVKGYYKGTARVTVGATFVHIQGDLVGENGETGRLRANNLAIDRDRFHGTGTFGGATVALSGRVEAPDGQIVKVSRVCCIFSVDDSHHGIIIGSRKGS